MYVYVQALLWEDKKTRFQRDKGWLQYVYKLFSDELMYYLI